MTATVFRSSRSAHLEAPRWRAAGLSVSYREKPPLQSTLCQRPRRVTPSGGAASPARNLSAAACTDPGIKVHVVMNFMVVILQFGFVRLKPLDECRAAQL